MSAHIPPAQRPARPTPIARQPLPDLRHLRRGVLVAVTCATVAAFNAATGARAATPTAIYAHASPAVVRVICEDHQGTGFVWGARDRVITARHVVASGRAIEIVDAGGERRGATVVRHDPQADLAELRLSAPLATAPLTAAPAMPPIGAPVCWIGHPYPGVVQGGSDEPMLAFSLACGRVAGYGGGYVQIDGPVNPGQSGGPLLDGDGKVIGVVVRRIRQAQAIGQASPLPWIEHLLAGPEIEGLSADPTGWLRVAYTVAGAAGGSVRHGPLLSGGLRLWDGLELGIAGTAGFGDVDEGVLGVDQTELGVHADVAWRFLVPMGQGRYAALRVGSLGGLLLVQRTERVLVLGEPGTCDEIDPTCHSARIEARTLAGQAVPAVRPWIGLDLGGVAMMAFVEVLLRDVQVRVGAGLGFEL